LEDNALSHRGSYGLVEEGVKAVAAKIMHKGQE
jgi:hypothetical protein